MIIIGEKLNGAIPSMAKAIAERDEDWIRDIAKKQADAGSDFIDVCSSVKNESDIETLHWLIDLVQSVCDTPISIDSPSPRSCIEAMKFCNKEGLINSVSMEGAKIDTIFPVIADTKWQCVALLCGDQGIPDNVDDRMEIFDQIMEKAMQYGIAPSRLHIDPLVTSLGTDPESFLNFSECSRRIKEAYPDIHITSGLSNISFGVPSRKTINQAFLTLARAAGMDSAIMDPTSRDMIGAIFATEALIAEDEFCIEYLDAYRNDRFGVQKK